MLTISLHKARWHNPSQPITTHHHITLHYSPLSGIVDLLPWKLDMISQKEIRTEGLFAALNDCLYRWDRSPSHRYGRSLQEHEESGVPGHDGPGRADHSLPEHQPHWHAGRAEAAQPGAGRQESLPPAGLLLQLPERILLPPVAGLGLPQCAPPARPDQD